MNKINEKGLKALEYKKELLKDYPDLVKQSLLISLEQLVENKIIDTDTYYLLKQDNIKYDEFYNYINTNTDFLKSEEELFREFEVIRENLNNILTDFNLDCEIETKSVIENDSIIVTKKYIIDKSFVSKYFGVYEEKELEKLMKRKGFVEKFAVLKLTKIFTDFIKSLNNNYQFFKTDISLVYYEPLSDSYNIDLYFDIFIENLEDKNKAIDIVKDIYHILDEANLYFNNQLPVK